MGIQFSQGDNAILQLTAQDGNGNPIDLTGASFSTQICEQNGSGLATFGNSQHTIIDAVNGRYTLTLSQSDTLSCGIGPNKDIVTQITQSGLPIYFHGNGILQVLANVPLS